MPNANQNPEQVARDNIDVQLHESGWAVQDKSATDFNDKQGQAIRGYTTDTGPADYVLFIDKNPVGVMRAGAQTSALIF